MNIALVEKEGMTPADRDNLTKFYVGLSLISFWDTSFFCAGQVRFFFLSSEAGWPLRVINQYYAQANAKRPASGLQQPLLASHQLQASKLLATFTVCGVARLHKVLIVFPLHAPYRSPIVGILFALVLSGFGLLRMLLQCAAAASAEMFL